MQPVPLRSGSERRSEIEVEGGREKIGARDGARIACGVPAIRNQEVAREAEFDRGRIAACASDAAENHAFAAPVHSFDEREQGFQRPRPGAAGQIRIVYAVLDVNEIGCRNLPLHVGVGIEFRSAAIPDRVVHDLYTRKRPPDVLHKPCKIPAPVLLRHSSAGVGVHWGDRFAFAIAHVEVKVHVVDPQTPVRASGQIIFRLLKPVRAVMRIGKVGRVLRACSLERIAVPGNVEPISPTIFQDPLRVRHGDVFPAGRRGGVDGIRIQIDPAIRIPCRFAVEVRRINQHAPVVLPDPRLHCGRSRRKILSERRCSLLHEPNLSLPQNAARH